MGVWTQDQQPTSAQPPPRSYEDYLREEQAAASADSAALDAEDQAARPQVSTPQQYQDNTVPTEVFLELQKRFKALKRGSPEKNYGIVDAEIGGKKYRYDAYAGQERQGFHRDRGAGPVANFFERLGTEFTGGRPAELQRMQSEAAGRLKEREMGADETYRQAMLASQERTRTEGRTSARLRLSGEIRNRAAQRYLQAQPKPRDPSQEGLSDAQAAAARAQADFYTARAQSVRGGRGPNGQGPKPDFTPDQAFTNMRQSEDEVRAIQEELGQIDQKKQPNVTAVPDWAEKLTGTGAYNPENYDVEIYSGQGKFPVKTIKGSDVPAYRKKLLRDLDYYTQQATKFREIVKNGNQVSDSEKGNDAYDDKFNDDDVPPGADDGGEGWDEASTVPAGSGDGGTIDPDQAGKLAAAPPSASGVPTAGKGRRPKPPPDVYAKLPYRDQLYYQLSDEYPEASDRELKIMALKVIAMQGTARGGAPARPAPGPGR